MNLYSFRISRICSSIQFIFRCQNYPQHSYPKTKFVVVLHVFRFHVSRCCFVVLQRTAKKCTKCLTHVQRYCSLNLLFSEVLDAVAIVICLNSTFPRKPPEAETPHAFLRRSKRCLRLRWLFSKTDYFPSVSGENQQREMTKFCVFWRTWTATANISNFYSELNAVFT